MLKMLKYILFFIVLPLKLISCSSGYKKADNRWVWVTYNEGNWGDSTILEADFESFKVLSDPRYATDSTTVFYDGNPIQAAHSKSFRLINADYAADDYQVYLKNYLVFGANPATFKPLRFPYSRDDKTIYCGAVPMHVEDMEHFRVTKSDRSYHVQTMDFFIKENPDYKALDTFPCRYVIIGYGEAKTKTERFKGFKKIN
jgi:hypothetical protein